MDHAKILLDAVINESSLTEVQKQLLKKHFKIDVEVEGTSKLREIGNALDDIAKKVAAFETLKQTLFKFDKSKKRFCPLWG